MVENMDKVCWAPEDNIRVLISIHTAAANCGNVIGIGRKQR